MFLSKVTAKELHIDYTFIPPGMSKGLEIRDLMKHPRGAGPTKLPNFGPIPRSEWVPRTEKLESNGELLSQLLDLHNIKVKDQNGTNYCWANAPTHCVEILRGVQNQEYISLSPASVAAIIKRGANQGGWGAEALEQIRDEGIAPSSLWSDNQRSGWSQLADSTKEARAKFKVTEWFDLPERSFDMLFTFVLMGIPVAIGLNWWSHEVTAVDPVILPGGKFGIRIDNSWGTSWGDKGRSILTESKATPDDAVAPGSTL